MGARIFGIKPLKTAEEREEAQQIPIDRPVERIDFGLVAQQHDRCKRQRDKPHAKILRMRQH